MKNMVSISKALKTRTELKNRLVRLLELEKQSFEVNIPVRFKNVEEALAEAPEEVNFKSFGDYETEIKDIVDQMTDLREYIDATAHMVFVEWNGEKISLARLRILVENKKADLARLKSLKKEKKGYIYEREGRLKNDDIEKSVQQITDTALESLMQECIAAKTDLESLLEKTNVENELMKLLEA